jgi:hypothetical protein
MFARVGWEGRGGGAIDLKIREGELVVAVVVRFKAERERGCERRRRWNRRLIVEPKTCAADWIGGAGGRTRK